MRVLTDEQVLLLDNDDFRAFWDGNANLSYYQAIKLYEKKINEKNTLINYC